MTKETQISETLELKGELVHLKPSCLNIYPKLQTILSDEKTMSHLKYMAYLERGGWTLDKIAEREQAWRLNVIFLS